jgi:hypothetical protein
MQYLKWKLSGLKPDRNFLFQLAQVAHPDVVCVTRGRIKKPLSNKIAHLDF